MQVHNYIFVLLQKAKFSELCGKYVYLTMI